MRIDKNGAFGSWLIGGAALGLLVWAVVDFVRLNTDAPIIVAQAPAASEIVSTAILEPAIELHRLLPDATDDIGALVRLDGVIVGAVTARGVWVRDLRDNVVFVAAQRSGGGIDPLSALHPGNAVRIVGRIARLSPEEQEARFAAAGLVLPETALVIRDIKILATADGIERLEE